MPKAYDHRKVRGFVRSPVDYWAVVLASSVQLASVVVAVVAAEVEVAGVVEALAAGTSGGGKL